MTASSTRKTLVIFCLMLLAGCGGKDKSQAVNISILPQRPIVFTAPFTYVNSAGTSISVTPPWIEFRVAVQVPDTVGESVTVIGLNAQASGSGQDSGSISTATTDFVAASFDYTGTDSAGNSFPCNYSYFGTFKPDGSVANLGLQNENSGACFTGDEVFIFGGLPGVTTGTISNPGVINTYNFTLMVSPEGWFGDLTHPTDRFVKSVYTTTQ